MCGIVAVYRKKNISIDVKQMLDSMSHRGKDQISINDYDDLTVGFRRLAITDISSTQPSGNKWVVYLNGEIYNYKDFGYSGNECSVISQGLEEYGLEFIKKLNGMFFILAINNGNVYAIRDRYGIKPVYHYEDESVMIVSSEISPILKYQNYTLRVCQSAKNQWLTFNNIFTNETLFAEIYKLPKAVIWNLRDNTKHIYWRWLFEPTPYKYGYWQCVDKIRELVCMAVDKMKPKEVSYGTCLSGGIDSGIIANLLPDNTYTFTAGFTEGADETELARLSGNLHYEIIYNKVVNFEESIKHLEDLRVGASWSNYGLYELASKYVKVLFDGAGSDELFSGYKWRYHEIDYYNVLNRTKQNNQYCKDLFDIIYTIDSLEERYRFDANYFLEGVLLVVDRLSMAHTIEVRLPFLDNDLVDFCLKLPNNFKEEKKILRDAFEYLLPKEVLKAKKQGFSSPDWFNGDGNQANKWAVTAYNQWLKQFI